MKTILVVEDEEAIAQVLEIALTDEGYRVVLAHDGKEALARLSEESPHLVLCDVMMPNLDGRAFYRRLKEDTALAAVPFIFLTAVPNALRGMEGHYTALIPKPFDLFEVVDTVNRVLG